MSSKSCGTKALHSIFVPHDASGLAAPTRTGPPPDCCVCSTVAFGLYFFLFSTFVACRISRSLEELSIQRTSSYSVGISGRSRCSRDQHGGHKRQTPCSTWRIRRSQGSNWTRIRRSNTSPGDDGRDSPIKSFFEDGLCSAPQTESTDVRKLPETTVTHISSDFLGQDLYWE
jgi:hypothetical protein